MKYEFKCARVFDLMFPQYGVFSSGLNLCNNVPKCIPIKDKFSPAYRLGKLLYPGRAPWEQRHKGKVLLWSAAMSLALGVVVAFIILHLYRKG